MDTPRKRLPGETTFAAALLLFALAALWQAYGIAGFSELSSPGAIPLAATAAMAVSAALVLLRQRRLAPPAREKGAFLKRIAPPAVLVLSATVLAFAALLDRLGFLIAATLFLAASIRLLGRRGGWRPALIALGAVAAVYVCFRLVFKVVLPEGIVPEREIIAAISDFLSGRTGR